MIDVGSLLLQVNVVNVAKTIHVRPPEGFELFGEGLFGKVKVSDLKLLCLFLNLLFGWLVVDHDFLKQDTAMIDFLLLLQVKGRIGRHSLKKQDLYR